MLDKIRSNTSSPLIDKLEKMMEALGYKEEDSGIFLTFKDGICIAHVLDRGSLRGMSVMPLNSCFSSRSCCRC